MKLSVAVFSALVFCLFLSDCYCFFFFILHSVLSVLIFLFSSLLPPSHLHLPHFSEMRRRVVCFLVRHLLCLHFLPPRAFKFPSLFSLSLSGFLCQDEKITLVFYLLSPLWGVFPPVLRHMLLVWRLGSNETDPLRIANVLRGNRLNYAHCGGEDVHNAAVKLLKVTQYLAPEASSCLQKMKHVLLKWHTSVRSPASAVRATEGDAAQPASEDMGWRFVLADGQITELKQQPLYIRLQSSE